jgi:Phage phiEco32-like COOH.NH2 ligase-type 2
MRLGTDPEVFLQDAKGNPVSAIGYINADKWNPMQIPDMPAGYTLQEDNVSLEYGVPPSASADEFVHHINAVMEKSMEYLPNLSFSKLSCIVFPKSQMNHPAAHIFGCEPDFCAWTKDVNKKPEPPHPLMRSAGGHVHVETTKDAIAVIRAMDLFLGVPSVLMDNGEMRKQLYGKAGAFRAKSYGVEYRTLSNFWIFKNELIRWVWDNTQRALDAVDVVDVDGLGERIQRSINNNDKAEAQALVNEFNLEVINAV